MSRIAGIIHPSAFKMSDLVGTMNHAFCSKEPFQGFRHQNLELGVWGTTFATNSQLKMWAALDGQIYNGDELKEDLKKLGYQFQANNDAELLIFAYAAWQEEFVKRLNGPFAFFLFDEKKALLILARDRIGQKSLYWTAKGDYWLFASETKGLLATGIVPQTPALDGLASFLYFGFIPQDFSAIQGVNKLLPGHLLKVNLARKVMIEQYWSLSTLFEKKLSESPEAIYSLFGKHFEEAVRRPLSPHAKRGASLTDSLGSSAATWFLSRYLSKNQLELFSSFNDAEEKKAESTQEMAARLDIPHHMHQVQPQDALKSLPEIIWHLDDPIADPHAIQIWSLSQIASQTCTQFYTDSGWVEMLAGSKRYFTQNDHTFKPPLAFWLAKLPPQVRDQVVLPFFQLVNLKYKYTILRNIDINLEQVAYLVKTALFRAKNFKQASPQLYKAFHPELFPQRFHKLTALSGSINFALYYDAKTALPDCLLTVYDKLFSARGINLVHPYLDNDMVEFLAHVPDSLKFESQTPGILLHHLMEKLAPTLLLPSEGANDYIEKWRHHQDFRHLFEKLKRGRLVEEGLISAKWLKHQLGYPYLIPSSFRQLWAVLIMEVWFRLFINRPIDVSLSRMSVEELLEA